jgi:CRP-like cAMP-binding protein
MPSSPLLGTLLASHLFHGVPAPLVDALALKSTRRRFRRGERIFRCGDQATFLGVVASGLIKLVRPVPDGSPCIICIWGPRQTIGNLAVVDGEPYPGDALVISDAAYVIIIPAEEILAAGKRHPEIAAALGRSLGEHGRALHDKIAIMSAGSVERRLKTLFALLMERFGDELDDGSRHIPIVLSRGELASLVGATIETTIRAMSKWQKQHLIATTPDGFRILDPQWARSTADDEPPASA